ncbi:MAG: ABC transporter substrate-binding protein [Clostridia bacterium]|nr:ABC transporter substrate-binding protein [Clostridia bacterium]
MKVFRLLAAALAAAVLLTAAGCAEESGGGSSKIPSPTIDYPVTVFDVTVAACPQRIVSLSPAVTGILTALGSDAQLVGVSDPCVVARELPRLGTSIAPDKEGIAALKPDLIFTTTALSASDKKALEAGGALVIPVAGAESYAALSGQYTQIAQAVSGAITGARNASRTFDRLDSRLKALRADNRVRVVTYYTPSLLVPRGGLASELLLFAGALNVAPGERADDAAVAASGAEVILCAEEDAAAMTARFPEVRVIPFDVTALEDSGERLIAALEGLNATLFEKTEKN